MSEKVFSIESHSPLEFFGVGDRNLNTIRDLYPKLKIIARGEFLKVIGDPSEVVAFEDFFHLLILHFERFGSITESDIRQLAEPGSGNGSPRRTRQAGARAHAAPRQRTWHRRPLKFQP